MVPCNAICAVWFTALLIAEPMEEAHQHRLIEASSAVRVGMTPDQVTAVLGEPEAEYGERTGLAWLLMGPRPKQWVYGTTLNLDYLIVPGLPFPNPWPVNVRVAEYARKDLVINWSDEDTVTAVRRPEFTVTKVADAMLESAYFVNIVFRSLVFNAS